MGYDEVQILMESLADKIEIKGKGMKYNREELILFLSKWGLNFLGVKIMCLNTKQGFNVISTEWRRFVVGKTR
jgi:hypothetical protein